MYIFPQAFVRIIITENICIKLLRVIWLKQQPSNMVNDLLEKFFCHSVFHIVDVFHIVVI